MKSKYNALIIFASVLLISPASTDAQSSRERVSLARLHEPGDGMLLDQLLGTHRCARSNIQGAANDCYAVCTSRDSSGARFLGVSGGGCDVACSAAADKCARGGQGGCSQLGECQSTNCN